MGIGTTSPNVAGFPDATLTIEGGSGSYGAFEIGSLSATASGDRLGEIRFYNKGTTAPYGLTGIRGLRGTNANDSQLTFWTSSSNSAAERLRIDSSGRVGLGVSSPNSILHLVGQGGSGWTLGARNTLQLQNANASSVNVSNAIVLGDQTDADRWYIMNDPNANGTTADVLTITNAIVTGKR